jgi:hypothetical protein
MVHYNDDGTGQTTGGSLHVSLDRTWQHASPMVTGLSPKEIMMGAAFKPLEHCNCGATDPQKR